MVLSGAVVIGGLLALVVTACQADPSPAPVPTRTATPSLVPYQFRAAVTATELLQVPPAATQTPRPTPTPFTYLVAEGDTLLTIAFRFSVSVDEIVAANPGVDSRFLSIDQVLVIPIGEGAEAVIASPTPVPLKRGAPVCYSAAEGGVWCFVPVLNELPFPVEGVEAEVSLYGLAGEQVAVQVAHPPVNRILAGEVVPLIVYFPAPIPDRVQPRALLRQAFVPGPPEGGLRYLQHEAGTWQYDISPDSGSASVSGQLRLIEQLEAPIELEITLVGVAYSDENEVVGLRRWELASDSETALGGLPFEFWVYSLGPDIATVDLFSEVRPAPSVTPEISP